MQISLVCMRSSLPISENSFQLTQSRLSRAHTTTSHARNCRSLISEKRVKSVMKEFCLTNDTAAGGSAGCGDKGRIDGKIQISSGLDREGRQESVRPRRTNTSGKNENHFHYVVGPDYMQVSHASEHLRACSMRCTRTCIFVCPCKRHTDLEDMKT